MRRSALPASAVLILASLASAQVVTIPGLPVELEGGDVLVTRLNRDDVGPQVIRYSASNPNGEIVSFGASVPLPAKFTVPTSGGELFVSNGTLFKNPTVVRINTATGEARTLFTPDILVTGMAYDEARDILWVTQLAPFTGTRLYAFGPDDTLEPTLIANTFAFNDEDSPATLNHLTDLSLDDEGNLFMIVKPFVSGSLEGNDRIARLDADTGELSFIHDDAGLLLQFPDGMDALAAMPDGTLVINSSPHTVFNTETNVFAVDTEGNVTGLFSFDSNFPLSGKLRHRFLVAETEDSFLFPLTTSGTNSESVCRYTFSTNQIEVALLSSGAFPGSGSVEDMFVVPEQDAGFQTLASSVGNTTTVRPDSKAYAKFRKAMLKAIKQAEKAAAKAAKQAEKEARRLARELARVEDGLDGWRN